VSFYIRKAFTFGPVRLNLSRSGLGASFGVKGARIGVGPRGTYIHAGRGGFYYRQTILPSRPQHPTPQPAQTIQTPSAELQQISSSAALAIDSSADTLLQEFNRVTKRKDVFAASVVAGVLLLIRAVLVPVEWWLLGGLVVAVALVATIARHNDVTNGTLLLRYSLNPESTDKFTRLQSAFSKLAACHRIWHVDASGHTDDWKRNAGVQTIVERSDARAGTGVPPKVNCNINVPTLAAKGTSLYFFPDRLLIRDGSGIGGVLYRDLQSGASAFRFVEDGYVPQDATQVDTTWRYVAKKGGPDRRFNNNRQLPVMRYGNLALASQSGVREMFQCSVPDTATEFCKALGEMGQRTDSESVDVSFATPEKGGTPSASLWLAVLTMVVAIVALPIPPEWRDSFAKPVVQAVQTPPELQRVETNLDLYLKTKKFQSASVSAVGTRLTLTVNDQNQKHARQTGLNPLNKNLLLAKVLPPNAEFDMCGAGIRTVEVRLNQSPPGELILNCNPQKGHKTRASSNSTEAKTSKMPPNTSND